MAFDGFDPRLNLGGFTALPNNFFDEVLPQIDNLAELKVLLATFRKTYGWISHIDQQTGQPVYKQQDAISYSQYEQMTGLSSPSISSGLDRAIKDGYMEKVSQGSYGGRGTTSVYKVKTKDNTTPPPRKTEPEPKPEPPVKPNIDTDKKPNGLATKDVEASKQDMLSELFGTKEDTSPQKPKKSGGRGSWKSKSRETWNCNDILSYYKDMYEIKFGEPFGLVSGKERSKCKSLCDEYTTPVVAQVADYLFGNRPSLGYLPQDAPNFHIFHGWFKAIYQSMTGGGKPSQPNMSVREFSETKHIDRKGVNTW
jgi:hypothetical protein